MDSTVLYDLREFLLKFSYSYLAATSVRLCANFLYYGGSNFRCKNDNYSFANV